MIKTPEVGKLVRNFLYGDTRNTYQDSILPWTIRYALKYGQAQLGAVEVLCLVDSGLLDFANYCILKATTKRPDLQEPFLEEFIDVVKNTPLDRTALAALQREAVSKLAEDFVPIQGGKLAQISRQGVRLWDSKFIEVAENLEKCPETVGVYVFYSASLGLRQAVGVLKNRRLIMLIPDWVNRSDDSNCGYEIYLGSPYGERVRPLQKIFERPENFIIIDDTQKTGVHLQSVWNFWSQNAKIPMPGNRVSIINKVPDHQFS